MTEPNDLDDLLALHLADGLGPHRFATLLEHFGTAARARRASTAELLRVPGIGAAIAARIGAADPAAERERLRQLGATVLALGQPGYPDALTELPGAPRLLFARGAILSGDLRAVALVGTRHPDAYGRKIARTLAEGLARAGVTVVSGLARGIDGLAHQGALEAGGRTLAVLGSGLGRLYPPEHRGLADRVAAAGAVLTEFRCEQPPAQWTFPARNRIISGLAQVTVIVQAPADSGALITAEHAADQGRSVLAVPGPIDSNQHGGCHRLIRDGAGLCRGLEDVLEELDGISARAVPARIAEEKGVAAPSRPAPAPQLEGMPRQVWEFLAGGARAGDEIARELALPVPRVAAVLLDLEMRRVIRRLPGNRYEKT